MALKLKLKRAFLKGKKFLKKNGPTICTVLGCVGVVATGALAWHERARCDEILSELSEDAGIGEVVSATWKTWVPVVGLGVLSIGAIVLSNGLSRKQIAALCATNAMSTGALLRTREEIDMKMAKIQDDVANIEALGLPDEERRQGIFESDCDNNVVCLNPDGDLYFDDWTGIWFRQLPSVVEAAYYNFNRMYAQDGTASLYDLYSMWGFGSKNAWSPLMPNANKFKEIGWEHYIAANKKNIRLMDEEDVVAAGTGEDFIDFRETNGKHMRIFGLGNTVSAWPRDGGYTRITYLYVPHELYIPFMNDDDLDMYMYNASYFGQMRFDPKLVSHRDY